MCDVCLVGLSYDAVIAALQRQVAGGCTRPWEGRAGFLNSVAVTHDLHLATSLAVRLGELDKASTGRLHWPTPRQ